MVSLTAPYVSGFLAFREAPFLVDAVRRLQEREPHLMPQVLLVDGNGVLHHRGDPALERQGPRGCGKDTGMEVVLTTPADPCALRQDPPSKEACFSSAPPLSCLPFWPPPAPGTGPPQEPLPVWT